MFTDELRQELRNDPNFKGSPLQATFDYYHQIGKLVDDERLGPSVAAMSPLQRLALRLHLAIDAAWMTPTIGLHVVRSMVGGLLFEVQTAPVAVGAGIDDVAQFKRQATTAILELPAAIQGGGEALAMSIDGLRRLEQVITAQVMLERERVPCAGEGWGAVKERAEKHVRDNGYPGQNALAAALGCSKALMSKVVQRSTMLRAAKAQHKAARSGRQRVGRAASMSDRLLEEASEAASSDMLAQLVAESEEDRRQEDARPLRARSR